VMRNFFIETERLRYAYGKKTPRWVLDSIDLRFRADEFVLVSGASGSGKSTLCRTFNGLIPHFHGGLLEGEIRIGGVSTRDLSVNRLFHKVGLIFQNPETQLFNSSVRQEIAFGLESLGLPREEIRRRIGESVERLRIDALLNRNPQELSGGEQQLVAIAGILALRPGCLVLDEPYANLDPANVDRVRTALREVHGKGNGVIIAEHRLSYTAPDVERMILLQNGTVPLDGPPAAILDQEMEDYGLHAPLAVQAGKRMGLQPLPLDVKTLLRTRNGVALPERWRPVFPDPVSPLSPVILEVEGLTFSPGGKMILRDIGFSLRRGECLAIVGANGAGKTILLKQVNGLHRPSEGRIRVMGEDTARIPASSLAGRIGTAFQNPNSQFFKMTVWDEITVGPKTLGNYDPAWARELMNLLHLPPLEGRAHFRLSGGEKKRVSFASALASKPAILALDEPTAGQGWYFRKALGTLLKNLKEMGKGVLLVTHDLSFAEEHAHRWLLLAGGERVAEGKPWDVMKDSEAMARAHLKPTDAFLLWGGDDPAGPQYR
jgi:energy-coupling factor transport system ATP-binding protein